VEAIEKLKKLDPRLALLVKLAAKGIKPVSKIDGFEGPEEAVSALIREAGLDVELKKAGCRSDILFGTKKGMEDYRRANLIEGDKRIEEVGKAFGYPDCCSSHFAKFMSGESKAKPGKNPPLEHFICPDCGKSGELKKKYEKEK
jgi:hypothetical protein